MKLEVSVENIRRSQKMNFNNGDEASFFKILFDDSEYLRLPSVFAEKYLEKDNSKKQTIILETKSGVKRQVKYLKIEDRHYFMGGWLKFKNENHLKMGDFLVFWLRFHHPNPTFRVFIYAPNGLLKHATRADHGRVTDSGNEEEPVDCFSPENMQKSLTLWRDMRASYKRHLPLTMDFVKAAGINGYGNLWLENNEGKMWSASLKKFGGKQMPHIGTGWFDFVKENKLKVGNRCSIDHVKDNVLRVQVFKSKGQRVWKRPRTNIIKGDESC